MKELPITVRPKPLKALLTGGRTAARFRRPADGMYRRLAPGDLLWLREQFFLHRKFDPRAPSQAEGPGVVPTFLADLDGQDPAALGLGISRASFTLPRFWSRFHFRVEAVALAPLLDLTETEARADGFSSRESWLAEYGDFVSSLTGRLKSRLAASNPTVLVIDTTLIRAPIDAAAALEIA